VRAEEFRTLATAADLEATRLLVSTQVARAWLGTIRSKSLLILLDQQRATSDNLVALTETRFANGRGSALDVLQQRQQRFSLESERLIEFDYKQQVNQLRLLTGGGPPNSFNSLSETIPTIQAAHSQIDPRRLLRYHPTVQRAMFQLQAADYDVATAVAERLPRIQLSLGLDFRASDISDLIDQSLASAASSLGIPLFDNQRRRAVVNERKARVGELLAALRSAFLETYIEIQDSLNLIEQRGVLVHTIKRQLEQARLTLKESRLRYINGASEYLQVVTALQSQQILERRFLTEQTTLAEAHIRLASATGGSTHSISRTETERDRTTGSSEVSHRTKARLPKQGALHGK
jgi:outer membrane protein, multidrug efflux system